MNTNIFFVRDLQNPQGQNYLALCPLAALIPNNFRTGEIKGEEKKQVSEVGVSPSPLPSPLFFSPNAESFDSFIEARSKKMSLMISS